VIAISTDPGQQVRVAEVVPLLGLFFGGFKSDVTDAPGRIGMNSDVISGGIPSHVQGGIGHTVEAQHAVLPGSRGQGAVQDLVAEFTLKVVEEHQSISRQGEGCNAFSQLVFIGGIRGDGETLSGDYPGNTIQQKPFAGSPNVGIHEKERCRALESEPG
jgi:hypothetical protein